MHCHTEVSVLETHSLMQSSVLKAHSLADYTLSQSVLYVWSSNPLFQLILVSTTQFCPSAVDGAVWSKNSSLTRSTRQSFPYTDTIDEIQLFHNRQLNYKFKQLSAKVFDRHLLYILTQAGTVKSQHTTEIANTNDHFYLFNNSKTDY